MTGSDSGLTKAARVPEHTVSKIHLMLERAQVMIRLLNEYGVGHEEIFREDCHNYGYWGSNFSAYFEWLAEGG